jgi:hypothetical protein
MIAPADVPSALKDVTPFAEPSETKTRPFESTAI